MGRRAIETLLGIHRTERLESPVHAAFGDAVVHHGDPKHAIHQAERLAHQSEVADESESYIGSGIRTVTEEHRVLTNRLRRRARFERRFGMELIEKVLDGHFDPCKVQLVDGAELVVVHPRVTAHFVPDALSHGNRRNVKCLA